MQFPMLVGLGSNLIPHATATETPDVDFTQLNTNAMHTAIGESGARVLLTGDWGDDVLFDQSYLVDMLSDLRPREVLNHLRAMPSWFADAEKRGFRRRFIRDLASNYLPENARTAVAFVRGSLHRRPRTATLGVRRPVRGQCAIRPRFQAYRRSMLQLFDPLLTRTRIERESKRASGRSLELALPYLDKELVSFMVGIPGEVQNSGAIPKGLLRVALADVMPPEITFRKWKADSTNNAVLSGIRKDGYQHLERAASGPIVSHGYVQRSRVLKASERDTANVSPSDFLRFVGTDSWMRAYAL